MGYGQVLRSSIRDGFFLQFVRRESRTFLFALGCAAGVPAFFLAVFYDWLFLFLLWATVMLFPFLAIAVKSRNLKWPALMYAGWFLNCIGLVQGAMKTLPPTSDCRLDFCVVKGNDCPEWAPDHGEK
jgi:hypothetical protein